MVWTYRPKAELQTTTNNFPQESRMRTVWKDLRYGARMLMKKPGFCE
jgi:hypothetical protein